MNTYTYFEHITEVNTHLLEQYFFSRYWKDKTITVETTF